MPSIPKLKPKAKRELEKLEEQKPKVKREKLEKPKVTDSKPIVKQEKQRFSYVTEEKRSDYTEQKPPKTTTYSTSWALRNFNSWAEHRNSRFPDSPVPTTLYKRRAQPLAVFLRTLETRNSEGKHYPPKSIYQLLTGLLRHMRSGNPSAPNFLEKTSPTFFQLHTVIDNHFKELRQQGVGSESKHAEIISKEEEDMLWKSGVMGTHSPQALFNAVFFFNGKNFCLRGGQEHRGLKLSQFKKKDDKYIYTENASKNHQGGLA